MAKSSIEVPEIGTVFITKKRGQRTMRLRVDTKGMVQISMPWMVPRRSAVDFIISKRDWIRQQQTEYKFEPYNGMLLGKTLRLEIQENSRQIRSRQERGSVIVPFGSVYDPTRPEHLDKVRKATMKALLNEAEAVLLPRLGELAEAYGFEYKSAAIKRLTGRWGSCDSSRHISLSLFLIQLPIELIDYVLVHELAHTKQMNHSGDFWKQVEAICPDYRDLRKRIRGLQPRIYDAKTFMA